MLFRNDGKSESNVIQNRFTAYSVEAIQRRKAAVLEKRNAVSRNEFSTNLHNDLAGMEAPHSDMMDVDVRLLIISFEQALDCLSPRERDIILARMQKKSSFEELAEKFGLTYKGVTSVYYRAIRKIKKELKGDTE